MIYDSIDYSHAILLYLVEKYAKNDDLYPKNDLLLRTKINEILFYEASYLFARFLDMAVNIVIQLFI
jgi:glutathione S-transferase